MDTNINIEDINKKLKNGLSIAKLERELGYGKDTLRKKLNRAGYSYNKTLKQYVTQENTESVTLEAKDITHGNTKCYKNNKTVYNNNIKQEVDSLELQKFKELDVIEKIKLVNNLTQGEKNLKEIEKEIGFTNIGKYMPKESCYWDGANKIYKLIGGQFTEEEVIILKEIIKNYKLQEKEKINVNELKDKTITTRSFRSYKEVMDNFAKYCKDNKLNQSKALAVALLDFMKKN